MKVSELVAKVRQGQPKVLGKLPDTRAARLVQGVLAQLAQEIQGMTSGKLAVVGLGRFVVREVASKKVPTEKRKRVVFHPAKVRAKGAGAAKGRGKARKGGGKNAAA
jgi:hypothetical protein